MKQFNLEHALKTRLAKDADGTTWHLSSVAVASQLLFWAASGMKVQSNFEGLLVESGPRASYLESAEVEKTIEKMYAIKRESDPRYTIVYDASDCPTCTVRFELTLNLEDGEIKTINVEKVR
jgi:hypothetical protein